MTFATGSPSAARAWLIVALLWGAGALNYLDRIMITTMRGSLTAAIPMSDAQFGLLTSAFLWTYAVLSPFAGFLADRFPRSLVITGSLFAWSATTWATAQAESFSELLLLRILLGVTQACYIPAALALIADYHRGNTRSLATGVHMSGILIGVGLSGFGGWIAERHGWPAAFTGFGVAGVLYAGGLALLLRDPARNTEDTAGAVTADAVRFGPALASLLRSRSFLIALAFWSMFGLAGWAVIGWMPTYLNEQFKLSQGVAGLSAMGYYQAAGLAGVLVGGAWADRWSRVHPRGRIFVPAIGLFVAAPGILLCASTPLLAVALGALVIFGFGRAFTDSNMMPVLCLVTDPRYRATGYGVLNCLACIVGGFTIYLGGVLRDAHVDVSRVFQFAAVSLVASGALLLCLRPAPGSAAVSPARS